MKKNLLLSISPFLYRLLNYRELYMVFFITLLPVKLFAQVPVISYSGPQVYRPGVAITPLSPTSSQVAAPAYSSSATTVGSGYANPVGVAVDAAGNVYVADAGNNNVKPTIYKIPADGGPQVVFSSSFNQLFAIAIDGANNFYVSSSTLWKIPGGSGTPINLGGFSQPQGIAVDAAGNVYVADTGTGYIKKIPSGGGSIIVLGMGFSSPTGIAVDNNGNVFVAENTGNIIWEIPAGGGSPVFIGSGNRPTGLVVDASGNLYFVDSGTQRIKEISAGTGVVTTIRTMSSPTAIATDASGNLYATGSSGFTHIVEKIKPVGGYYIAPFLPAGLNFNASTGIISGTPVSTSPATNYIATAYNSSGSSSATLNLTISSTPIVTLSAVTGNIFAFVGTASVSPQIKQFTVSGVNLTGDIIATAPANVEVSLASGSGYSSSITITQSGGVTGNTTVYVRSAASAPVGSISGNITLTSTGFTQNVAVTGTVSAALPIVASTVTGNISACQGTASASPNLQQFTVAGTGLTGNIIATAPTGFELSLASGSGYAGTVTLTQSGGAVNNTVIYVRSAATAPAGTISGNVVLSSTGATSQNVAITGRINALPVADPITNQTVVNGDTTTTINFTGTGNTFTWVNDTPGIGLAASGTGKIASFTAVNKTASPVTATITVSPASTGMVYAANQDYDNVSVVNIATNKTVATIPVGTTPQGVTLSHDGTRVYTANYYSNNISVINTATNTVMATIRVGINPRAMVLSPDDSRLYVANEHSNTLSVINTATNTIAATITVGETPFFLAVSPDGSRVYVENGSSKNISVVNTATNTVITTINLGVFVNTTSLSPDGGRLYLGTSVNSVLVVNTSTNTVVATIPLSDPGYFAISPDGSRCYIINGSGAVSVVNAATNTVIATITVGSQPQGLCISPDGSKVYVANTNSNNVSVIDATSNTVVSTIPTGKSPTDISPSADGNQVFVLNNNNVVSVINVLSNTVVSNLSVGKFPASFATSGTGCSGAAATFTITVNPSPPAIHGGTAAGTISACLGSASLNTQRFMVTGNGLTGNITATAPAGFEVSLAYSSGFASAVTITQVAGKVDSTLIYVRSAATAPVGSISGNVTLTSPGITSQNVAVTGTINTLPTVNTIPNQTITNGGSTAAINFTGTGNTFTWVNDTPGAGLAASGIGNIASFTGVNTGSTPVTATITVTPVSAGFAYIANFNSNNVSVINTVTDAVIATIPVGKGPTAVGRTPDGSRVYVANLQDNTVSVINTVTNTVVTTIAVAATPNAVLVSPDGSLVYVVNSYPGNSISEISTSTNTVVSTITLSSGTTSIPEDIAVSPDGSLLYISSGSELRVVNTATNAVVSSIPGATGGLALNQDGSLLYATHTGVDVINTITNTHTATIAVGSAPRQIAVSPDGDRIYVTNGNSGTVSVINTITNTVIATITVGSGANGLSMNSDGSKVYVANYNSNTVSVINTITNAVIATIPVGQGPISDGNFIAGGLSCSGAPVTFTITVNPSNNPSLSSLTMNPGSPLILASSAVGTVNYTTGVDATTSSVTLTPIATYPSGTITVNGVPVTSGTASAPIPLNSGPTLITTVVTAPDGIATKTYTVTVNKTGSNSGALSTLILSPASPLLLTSATVSNVNYKTSVDPSINTVTFTPTVVEAGATITVNGVAVSSGSASGPITLNTGPTTITVLVTAPDGSTIKTYAVTVIRASNNATLSTLIMNPPGAMFPAFGPASVNYTTAVDPAVSSIRITPTTQDANATVTVNGVPVSSGSASGVIALNSGPTLITTVVTAPDGITTKTYNVTVNRTGSNNGTLNALIMNPGSTLFLTSANTTAVDYTTSVEPTVTSVTFNPSVQQPGATITVNGVAVRSGTTSGPIALNSGPTIIPTVVTAPDGVTTKTYYVTVNKVGSNNARLNALILNPHSALALVSSTPTNVEYTTVVPDTVGTVTLTAITTDPNATFTINGTNASPATITLNVGDNLVTTLVTAHDGVTTKTYNITITRPAALVGVVNKHSLSLPAVVGSLADNMQNDGITVHQGVSPNGDGIADVFTIDGITAYPDNKLTIVDRSGAPVFEASGYDNTSKVFNGRSNKTGAMQHAGTYYYLLEYRNKGQLKRKTGYLIIKY